MLSFVIKVSAQEVILSDKNIPQTNHISKFTPNKTSHSYKANALSLPFYDDFNQSNKMPDTSKWISSVQNGSDVPNLTWNIAINPPSFGVATFDGSNSYGIAYDGQIVNTDVGDILESQAIDLSTNSSGDSLYFSFFYQAQGKGDVPETNDSLRLFFRDTSGTYIQVWAKEGDSAKNFEQVLIPITDAAFFHDNFRIRFNSTATRNGYYDHWHIDYVYLNQGRSFSDTIYNDLAIASLTNSIFAPYTLLPNSMIAAIGNFSSSSIELYNLRNSATSTNTQLSLTDTSSGNIIYTNTQNSISTNPLSNQSVVFSSQSIPTLNDTSVIKAQYLINTSSSDSRPENDTLVQFYPITGTLAQDDSEADGNYGIFGTGSIAQRFTIPSPDTLTAVEICFVSNYYVLEGTSFTLRILTGLTKPSDTSSTVFLKEVAGNINYGDKINHFETYNLMPDTLIIQNTLVVEIYDFDTNPIGVGLDYSLDNSSNVFYDSSGVWSNTTFPITLMIRPVFGNAAQIISNEKSIENASNSVKVFPNPFSSQLNLKLEEAEKYESISVKVYDICGKLIFNKPELQSKNQLVFKEFENLQKGIYLMNLELKEKNGQSKFIQKKIVKQ